MRERLRAHEPRLAVPDEHGHAAVAIVLRSGETRGPAPERGIELLFVQRAEHEEDPWSGQIGFPGGRIEAQDATARAAAERETREEIGLDLSAAEHLGRLDDYRSITRPILVSTFVYHVRAASPFSLDREIADAFWVPSKRIVDPARRAHHLFSLPGGARQLPAVRILDGERPLLWGLTYRIVAMFFRLIGAPWPAEETERDPRLADAADAPAPRDAGRRGL